MLEELGRLAGTVDSRGGNSARRLGNAQMALEALAGAPREEIDERQLHRAEGRGIAIDIVGVRAHPSLDLAQISQRFDAVGAPAGNCRQRRRHGLAGDINARTSFAEPPMPVTTVGDHDDVLGALANGRGMLEPRSERESAG